MVHGVLVVVKLGVVSSAFSVLELFSHTIVIVGFRQRRLIEMYHLDSTGFV